MERENYERETKQVEAYNLMFRRERVSTSDKNDTMQNGRKKSRRSML
jgi:hypothetical protein